MQEIVALRMTFFYIIRTLWNSNCSMQMKLSSLMHIVHTLLNGFSCSDFHRCQMQLLNEPGGKSFEGLKNHFEEASLRCDNLVKSGILSAQSFTFRS